MKWWLAVLALAGLASIASAAPSFRGTGVVGVWMGSTAGALPSTSSGAKLDAVKRKVEWRVVYDDGRIFRGLPTAGLAELDIAQHEAAAHKGTYVAARGACGRPTARP